MQLGVGRASDNALLRPPLHSAAMIAAESRAPIQAAIDALTPSPAGAGPHTYAVTRGVSRSCAPGEIMIPTTSS